MQLLRLSRFHAPTVTLARTYADHVAGASMSLTMYYDRVERRWQHPTDTAGSQTTCSSDLEFRAL